jgi:hypothetical protein
VDLDQKPERQMKKLAMIAVLFAVAFAAVGCGDTKPSGKPAGTSSTPPSKS